MQLTEDDIREFRQAWKEDFAEFITPEQASREALMLLEIYAVLYRRAGNEQSDPSRQPNHDP